MNREEFNDFKYKFIEARNERKFFSALVYMFILIVESFLSFGRDEENEKETPSNGRVVDDKQIFKEQVKQIFGHNYIMRYVLPGGIPLRRLESFRLAIDENNEHLMLIGLSEPTALAILEKVPHTFLDKESESRMAYARGYMYSDSKYTVCIPIGKADPKSGFVKYLMAASEMVRIPSNDLITESPYYLVLVNRYITTLKTIENTFEEAIEVNGNIPDDILDMSAGILKTVIADFEELEQRENEIRERDKVATIHSLKERLAQEETFVNLRTKGFSGTASKSTDV